MIAAHREDEPDVADQVPDPWRHRELVEALAELSPELRRALVLHEMQGLPYGQLAAVEHISPQNARARAHRARKAVRDRLTDRCPATERLAQRGA